MQEYRLPRVIHQLQNKKNSQTIGNRLRQRKVIAHKRHHLPQHSVTASGVAGLHQIINLSTSNLTVLQKGRSLSECIGNKRMVSLTQLPSNPKKVLIFNQRCPGSKENQIDKLKAFKSLLNIKSKTPKKVIVFIAYRKVSNSIRSVHRQAGPFAVVAGQQPVQHRGPQVAQMRGLLPLALEQPIAVTQMIASYFLALCSCIGLQCGQRDSCWLASC